MPLLSTRQTSSWPPGYPKGIYLREGYSLPTSPPSRTFSAISETSAKQRVPLAINVANSSRKAALLSAADILARQGIQFLVQIGLTRLLSPADFGVLAILNLISTGALVLVEGGFSVAIIQHQGGDPELESSAFWINALLGLTCAALLALASPYIAVFFQQADLNSLTYVVSVSIFFSSLTTVPNAILTRDLRFSNLLLVGLITTTVSGCVGIILAIKSFGPWALAGQLLAMSVVNAGAVWAISGWRPIMFCRVGHLRPLFSFSSNIMLSGVFNFLYNQGNSIVIAKLYGSEQLGLYNRASSLQLFASGLITSLVARVTLPIFSARVAKGESIRESLRWSLQNAMALNVPAMLGLALTSDLVVSLLFGERWEDAAEILAILCLYGMLLPIHIVNLQGLLASGEAALFLRLNLCKQALGLLCIAFGSPFGLKGLAWSQVAFGVAASIINAAPSGRRFGYDLLAQVYDLIPICIATTGMGFFILWFRSTMNITGVSGLAILVFSGAAIYILLSVLLRVNVVRNAISSNVRFPKRVGRDVSFK